MRVINIASGSKGNCTIIATNNATIMLDCGLGIRELISRLSEAGINAEDIDAIVITHEHSDHIKGLNSFTRKFKKPVYAHKQVWPYIEKYASDINNSCERYFESLPFYVKDVLITPFAVSHDSKNCQGYTFECKKAKFSYATDLGFVSGENMAHLMGSKLVFIESNHDEKMLIDNPLYPPVLKARIRGNSGHLSNKQCAEAVVSLAGSGTRYFALCHLSEHNNTPELAFGVVANALTNSGFQVEKNVFLRLTYQHKIGNNFYLKED
ncbi:MAG: MBL fold metallo-hydrolase [Clostridia bacterium]|nr:MBL fold metallo-hydrolase [Clostridia bacterium]